MCRWVYTYAARCWPEMLAVLACMLAGIVLSVLQPWPMKLLVDYVLDAKPLPANVAWLIHWLPGASSLENLLAWSVGGTIIIFLLNWTVGLVSAYVSAGLGQRMTYALAADLFGHLQRLSLGFHTRKHLGDTIARVTNDTGSVSTIVLGALLPVITSVFTLVAMFSVMWQVNTSLTLLSVAVVPFMVAVFWIYAESLVKRSYQQQEVEARLYNLTEQTLSSIPAVQAYTAEDQNEREFELRSRENVRAMMATTSVQMQFKVLIGLATAVGTAGILWIGGREVIQGNLTAGSILIFLSYLGSLYAPLNQLMYTSSTVQSASGSARRVIEMLETEHDVVDKPEAISLPTIKGKLVFEDVSFGYDTDDPFLKGISLTANPGETIAIVGKSGAGKTTLVGMIPRFFDPWTGCVRVDGHDLRDVRIKSLRSQIALVLQEPFLFPISVAENIAYGRPDATREEIIAAGKAANAHTFIQRLPEGYDTVIGERGATLSGGERQRLSIARALLKDAPVLVLDEPTSALDVGTEALLLEALERLMKGRTTFIVAHRFSTIRNATRIVVLEGGQVAETGSHEELLRRGGLYAHLHDLQFRAGRHD
jgi:ATP-binding cassette subfamily B protein